VDFGERDRALCLADSRSGGSGVAHCDWMWPHPTLPPHEVAPEHATFRSMSGGPNPVRRCGGINQPVTKP
jgi:hypothetical protein